MEAVYPKFDDEPSHVQNQLPVLMLDNHILRKIKSILQNFRKSGKFFAWVYDSIEAGVHFLLNNIGQKGLSGFGKRTVVITDYYFGEVNSAGLRHGRGAWIDDLGCI